ncbi:MAG: 50S ribosomal protein L31e [Candidatus Micrarchaeia archaeon]
MDERLYTISFSKIYSLGRHRERARKAIKYLRAFSARHMKTTEDKVVIGTDVNEYVWRNGIQRPPRKIRVKMMKDKDGTVMVSLEQPAAKAEEKQPQVKKEKAVKQPTKIKAEQKKPAAKPENKKTEPKQKEPPLKSGVVKAESEKAAQASGAGQ